MRPSVARIAVNCLVINKLREKIMDKAEKDVPVKDGGLKIVDFDDLKIAFLELNEKHNALAASYRSYRNEHSNDDFMRRQYGL